MQNDEIIQFLQLSLDRSADAIFCLSPDGRIFFANQTAGHLLEAKRDDLVGESFGDIDPSFENAPETYRRVQKTGKRQTFQTQLNTSTGMCIPVEAAVDFMSFQSRSYFCLYARDIRKLQQMQSEIQKAQEESARLRLGTEAANRIKGEFLGKISHEIRTPMNGIIGMADLLIETELNDEQYEFLSLIKTSADSLIRVINDTLDFSKIETGKLKLDRVNFQLRDCVGDILNTLAMQTKNTGTKLNSRIDPSVPDNLVGDPGRLRQIIMNLVDNAKRIILCSPGERGDAQRGLELGIDAYLMKPIKQIELLSTIQLVLERDADAAAPLITRQVLREKNNPSNASMAKNDQTNQQQDVCFMTDCEHYVQGKLCAF